MTIVDKIKSLCESKGTTMTALERELEFGKGVIRKWDSAAPNSDKLQKVADYFHVTTDYLLGREEKSLELNARNKRDIAKTLEEIMDNIDQGNALAYGGEIKEEDRELYKMALQHALEIAKLKSKEKFTPKKYK
ncbi:helix-turn-helix domain-containing protein [Cellulosilyticum lentocellum]|uniref:Helix-turn-helix domain protein n=1 Tax=Cellulosilyticum lentocellum (strain ATCC 49066 / DSM 5427 / NCIMB 11756 / RHM5) TaxID=642492 RepID=F2JQR5_CELLD|nr:helix-turn-helix transcriptional regulator [Cellulosilyticum lentocellum]ADZ82660.1 helix-turn-helix domain protein [Cellulosilyticum lentocellum DSM 5427]